MTLHEAAEQVLKELQQLIENCNFPKVVWQRPHISALTAALAEPVEKKLDWTRPIRTKSGEPATFIRMQDDVKYPRRVRVDGSEEFTFTETGRFYTGSPGPLDLENVEGGE